MSDDANPTCTCGHVEDEHRDNGSCDVTDPLTGFECQCAGWDEE